MVEHAFITSSGLLGPSFTLGTALCPPGHDERISLCLEFGVRDHSREVLLKALKAPKIAAVAHERGPEWLCLSMLPCNGW